MLLMVHEYTLFTLVRRKSEFKNIQDVAAEIWQCCSWHKHVGEVSIGKNTNRKLNGSLTGMKRITEGWYTPDQINSMEMQINSFLFSYLSPSKKGYGKPFEAVEKYMTGLYPQK